jgi:hypothetical protein
MAQEPLHHWTHTGNTRHSHSGVHAGYSGRNLRSLAGRRAHRVGTATQGMGRTLGERTKKKKGERERDSGSYKLSFFFSAFTDPRGCNWRDSCADPARSPTAFQPHALLPIPRPRSCRHTHPARPRIVPLRTLWAPILTQEFTRVIPS